MGQTAQYMKRRRERGVPQNTKMSSWSNKTRGPSNQCFGRGLC
ncbi:uncharacterized protein J3R85_013036 [Psidium guajava]|nr:uncharacterized protein J3R85_013036 [Psidium guajava]